MSELTPISAGGGVLFRSGRIKTDVPEIVTIYRRGKWDLPKGKLENSESIQDCAVREVCEEIGLNDPPSIVSFLDDTMHEYQRNGTHYQKYTYWFCMKLPSKSDNTFTPQEIEDIEKVEWMDLNKAMKLAGYTNIVDLLNTFEKWWDRRKER